MKKVLLSAFTALLTLCVYGQELPEIVPPSPEASSLGKFTEVPISHYTGVPNISIPIYTINASGVSIPIQLSYHARGVQVSEVASRVGLGWALSYGGSLSRQTRGGFDESAYGYFANSIRIDNSFESQAARAQIYNLLLSNDVIGLSSDDHNIYQSGYGFDMDPDKFMLNANGSSGSFIFDYKDLKPILQSYGDIKVTHFMLNGEIDRFEVIDVNGITYYFGKSKDGTRAAKNKERVAASYAYHAYKHIPGVNSGPYNEQLQPPAEGPFPNSWQLMDIEALDGSLIEFHYEKEEMTYYRRSGDAINSSGLPIMHYSKIISDQYQISEIVFDKDTIANKSNKVRFIKTTSNREDLTLIGAESGHTLDRIEVLDKNDKIIKKVQLGYEYKTATTNGNEHPHLLAVDSTAVKRLYLKTIKERDSVGNELPGHSFTYSSEELPSRFSNSQDAWGHYNGADNGHYLTFVNYNTTYINRTVDTVKAEAGMLQKITYPTGGSTSFIYEHNRAIPTTDFREIVTAGVNPIHDRDETMSQLDYGNDYNHSTNQYERLIEIKEVYQGGIDFNISFQNTIGCIRDEPDCKFDIFLEGPNNYDERLFLGANNLNPPSGIYTLIVKPKFNPYVFNDFDQFFMVEMNWFEQESDESIEVFTAGKRIKRIEFKDSDDSLVSFKEYEYLQSDGVTSSGKLYGLPNFRSVNRNLSLGSAIILEAANTSPGGALSAPQGNATGYEYVTEYYGEKNNNIGKTEYKFTSFYDDGEWFKFPFHLPVDQEWLRGRPLETKMYRANKDNLHNIIDYTLQKEIDNTYLYANVVGTHVDLAVLTIPDIPINTNLSTISSLDHTKDEFRYRFPFIKLFHPYDITGMNVDVNTVDYKVYHITGGTQNLHKTTTKNYYEGGIVHTTTTTNSYDYTKHYQQKGSKMTDSNGDVIETTNYFPVEVKYDTDLGYDNLTVNELNAIKKLQASTVSNPTGTHQVATPVQVETKKNNVLISALRTNFNIDTNSGQVLPKNVETLKGVYNATSNLLEERIVYDSYYANGKVQQVRKKDGTPIVYIWGYNQTVPIAKIENATYSQIQSYVFTIEAASNADNDRTEGIAGKEGDLRATIQTLRAALTDAQVTSFTYDPLIGVTSITDPRGRTIYYHYDSFNRLQFIKDHDGNIVNENQYHYKN
ncbi:MAG: RHS repeat protein [Flavobacteriaceae bacterium]